MRKQQYSIYSKFVGSRLYRSAHLMITTLVSGLLLLLTETAMAEAHAKASFFDSLEWEGFVSQNLIYSSDYDYFSRSENNVSTDMWEAGLLFSGELSSGLGFSAQLLGRKVSEYSDEDIRVDYAFLSYPLYRTSNESLGVRLGRIRSSYGFYNETRDIPHTRTGIVMPQAVYFDMTRNSFYSADGIELFAYKDFDDQRLSFQVFASRPVADKDEAEEAARLRPRQLEGKKSILAKIAYGSEFDGARAALTYYRPEYDVSVNFDVNVPPAVTVTEPDASFYSESILSSLEYNELNWSLTLEYLRHKFQTNIPALSDIGRDSVSAGYEQAYYLQGIYRINENWETYARYERSWVRNVSTDDSFYRDFNVGITFRPNESWIIRAETHYVEGRAKLLKRDNAGNVDDDKYWSTVLFQVAYRF